MIGETSGGWEVKGQQRRKTCVKAEKTWVRLQSQHDSLPMRGWSYVKVFTITDDYWIPFFENFNYFFSQSGLSFITSLILFVFPAGFKRPVVIFGPISDAVNDKLASDMPNDFVIASKWWLNPISCYTRLGGNVWFSLCVRVNNYRNCLRRPSYLHVAFQWFILVSPDVLFNSWFIIQTPNKWILVTALQVLILSTFVLAELLKLYYSRLLSVILSFF